jgi:hypothetical protein
VSGAIGKISVPIVESDRSPSLVTEGSLEPEVFDDAIDPEGSELENRVDKLDMEIDQREDFDEDSFAEQGIDQNEDFGDDSFAEQGIEQENVLKSMLAIGLNLLSFLIYGLNMLNS